MFFLWLIIVGDVQKCKLEHNILNIDDTLWLFQSDVGVFIIGCQKYLQKHLCHFLLCIPYLLTEISCRILWLYTGCIAYIGTIILSPCHWSWFWSGDQLSVKYWHSRPASSQQLAPGNELKQIIYCKSSQHYYKHTQESRGRGGNQ